jgi:hypothetical protein
MKRCVEAVFAIFLLGGFALYAQNVISAQSGMVHYTEGKVLLAGKPIEPSMTNFPGLKENQELRTEQGRAEVLLTPGVFLRLAENSAIRMISNRLTDSRLEFLAGSAVVESADLLKDNAVAVVFRDSTVQLRKNGIYRFDSAPAQLRVFDGEAAVRTGSQELVVKAGKLLSFDGMAVEKFDRNLGDALDRWSRRRDGYIAMANISGAKTLADYGYSYRSGWLWNPYFGMYTFVPGSGMYWSPYGFRYWSPYTVYQVYQPQPMYTGGGGGGGMYNSNLGYTTMPQTSSGHSGTMAVATPSVSAPTTAASGAAAAPVSRESGHAGGARR